MELCQTWEEKGVYHGLKAFLKAVSEPTSKEQSILPSQHLPHPDPGEFNAFPVSYWLLEQCCFDQPHPPPAPSRMWMKKEKDKFRGDSPRLCFLSINLKVTICPTQTMWLYLLQSKSNNPEVSLRENKRLP